MPQAHTAKQTASQGTRELLDRKDAAWLCQTRGSCPKNGCAAGIHEKKTLTGRLSGMSLMNGKYFIGTLYRGCLTAMLYALTPVQMMSLNITGYVQSKKARGYHTSDFLAISTSARILHQNDCQE